MRAKRIEPNPGQESAWDYPRPPRVEMLSRRARVVFNGVTIADSPRAFRVLETYHPPAIYIPPGDVQMQYLTVTAKRTECEFKGTASYWTVQVGDRKAENAAWRYANPTPVYDPIRGCFAFYPERMEACYLDDELVTAQAGDFYGGWITADIVGPFKGEPGVLFL